MNQEHYQIATELANALTADGYSGFTEEQEQAITVAVRDLSHALANILSDNNATFNRAQFLTACGITK